MGGGPQAPDALRLPAPLEPRADRELRLVLDVPERTGGPQVGPKASQAVPVATAPGGTSLLCLSCHDGSLAVNSYGTTSQATASQSGGGGTIGVQYVIGKDNYLGNHHPIGFSYDAAQSVDTEIRSADTASLGGAGLVRDHLYGASGYMECSTCHSVHSKGNTGESLLWRATRTAGSV